jgi:hypothetical protein
MLEIMYYEIFKGVVTSVATSAISTAVKSAIERYFGKGSTAQATPEETQYPIISIPLAIGYYYNFIEKIEDRLGGDNLTVKRHYTVQGDQVFNKLAVSEEQKSRLSSSELNQLRSKRIEMAEFLGQFGTSAVSVELIYPKDLSNPAIRGCAAFLFEKTNQGSIESAVAGRPYGINYADIQEGQSPEIRIVDYTRPVEVIPRYYQEVKGVGGMGSDQELWRRIEDREMQAFLYTLKYMIENKSKFLFNKVYFRPYDSVAGGARA